MRLQYPVNIEQQDDGTFLVTSPDLPGLITDGRTLEEARFNAVEALSGLLETMIEFGDPIPAPSEPSGAQVLITPEANVQAALLLRLLRGQTALAELARMLETSWPTVQRLEDPRHWPNLRSVDRAVRAHGHRLVISVEPVTPTPPESAAHADRAARSDRSARRGSRPA